MNPQTRYAAQRIDHRVSVSEEHKMKKLCLVAIWLVMLFMLSSCRRWGYDSETEKSCNEGVCAEITVSQPVVLNQPIDVTVRISSTVDYPDLLIALQGSAPASFGEPASWEYDAVTDQSQDFHSTVTFPSESEYLVAVVAFDNKRGGPVVSNQDRVLITSDGFVINPTTDPHPTSDLFIASTPKP